MIEDVLAAIPDWRGLPAEVEPLSGGLTNRGYRVRVGGRDHFVSVPGRHSDLLTIPRADEIRNARLAARTGISPGVLHVLPETGVVVFEFIPGRTLTPDDLHRSGMPERLAASARTLHTAARFVNDFDLFRLTRSYRRQIADRGLAPPAGFDEFEARLRDMEAAARSHPEPSLPCSNDLVCGNLIDDGARLWIVDFGYSGNNDPCSELGNAACEADYDEAGYEALCAAYFGQTDPRRLARMRLFAVMSDVAWSLWSVIQEQVSDLEVDFSAYGAQRWDRARTRLGSSDLDVWIRRA